MPRVGNVSVILVIIGVAIAFGAGKRWQHSQRAFSDHRLARTGIRTTRKNRLVSVRATVVLVILLAAYLVGTLLVAIEGHSDEGQQPGPGATSESNGHKTG